MQKSIVIILLSLLLLACAESRGDQEYMQSRNGMTLIVPQPLTSTNISHFYDLPPQEQDAHVSIAPPGG